MIDDSPKNFMVRSSQHKVDLFNAIAEKHHIDIHSILNSMMLKWVLENLDDDDLVEPVKEIFKHYS